LPTPTRDLFALTTERAFLIKTTGVYTIGVGNAGTFATPNAVPNIDPVAQAVGDYNFTLQVFDDGDSGFTAPTDSGDGGLIVDAPTPIAFAGPNGVFDNGGDDATEIRLNGYTFTLNRGADGLPNTSDDVVTGSNGITTSSRDGNGRLVSTISAAIGLAGHAGVPIDVASDVDIFHLNSRQPIIAGTKLRVTVKLTEAGADLGSNTVVAQPLSDSNPPIDRRGAVQFGVFETTGSTTIEDGTAIFSPTDFLPYGGTPSRVIADNGSTKYGYDANGDFFVEFVAPPSSVAGTTSGSFAVYMQGLFNTDYQLEVVTNGTATQAAAQRQNFLLETRGGTINWLEAGGLTTNVGAFSGRTLGFNGTIANGQLADDYILSNLVTSLNSIFQGALGGSQPGQRGYDVRFSTNPADFEFQPFSTIYLTSTSDPLSTLFSSFFFGIPLFNTRFGFFGTQPFGFSQHSDVMNANLQDEAVVFAPSFGLLGLSPAQADADRFVQSLTTAVGRRAGELMGLRVTSENDFGGAAVSFDFMAADAVTTQPGPGRSYVLSNANRILSTGFDSVDRTDFFLGRQNSRSLLDRIIARN
jgi:hypothetical protein